MRTRIVIGAGAWLLGAAAATAGGLLVVSELGEGISASPASQQSSVAAAVQAQASQAVTKPSKSPTPRSQARVDQRQLDVLERREPLQQVEPLEDEA